MDEPQKSSSSLLGCLVFILLIIIIGLLAFEFGGPVYDKYFKHKKLPTPTPVPVVFAQPTPTPTPTPTEAPTPTPTPTPSPTPTPKPTVWTAPPPNRQYPSEWVSIVDGSKYENVKVIAVEPDRVTVNCDAGTVFIQISTLAPDIQKLLNFDADLAGKAAAQRDMDRINDATKEKVNSDQEHQAP